MTTTRRNHLTTSHNRSPFILERRRKLFPIDDHDMESELGHMSPICSDTSSDSDNEGVTSISDYDIMGIVQNKKMVGCETPVSNKAFSDTMSPLRLSPCTTTIIGETPTKFSPSRNLKTPHDTSTKPVLQREQKTLLEESKSSKRKSSPSSSPEQSKSFKTDNNKPSKVRTALFPPEEDRYASLSTKSFYSKSRVDIIEKLSANKDRYIPKPIKYSTVKHSYRPKKKFGQINNGVGHKIRKPKQRSMSKAVIAKAAKKLLETGSVLNDYIKDLVELKSKQKTENKLIINPMGVKETVVPEKPVEDPALAGYLNDVKDMQTTKKLIIAPVKQSNESFGEENKENIEVEPRPRSVSPLNPSSPENTKRKFFKSSRAKITSRKPEKIQEKTKESSNKLDTEQESGKQFILPNSEEVVTSIQLDNSNDFEDEDLEPGANIDNILSVLSEESPQKSVVNDNEHLDSEQSGYNSDVVRSIFAESGLKFDGLDPQINGFDGECYDTNGALSTNDVECHKANDDGFTNNLDANLPHLESSRVVFNNLLVEENNKDLVDSVSCQNEQLPAATNVTNPEAGKTTNSLNRITLEAHNSILASENSIHLHRSDVANMILSPISQMCDVTSGLALNSPKKRRNLTMLSNMSRAHKILSFTNCSSADMEQQKKLFPVFYPGAKGTERGEKRERVDVKRSAKKFKALHEDQMLLDAGQKKFGYTICNECNIVYHMGDPGDEIEHMNYHNASHILRFGGWKNESVVADFQKSGRIIRVLPTDSKIWLKRVKELMEFVKRDLGCYEMEYDISGSQVYLFIKNRTIAGCVVATVPKEDGHRMLSSVNNVSMCSEESYPIKCGISHIWVAANFRKQGIATALLNAVKTNFFYGYILANDDMALTSPTEAGSAFAEKYFKTPNYLIYYT